MKFFLKRRVHLVFILSLAFFCFKAQAQAPDPDFSDKMALSEGRAWLKRATFTEQTGYDSYDLVSQRLYFEVDPAINYIAGRVVSQVLMLKENITTISFDLSSALTVDSVKFDLKEREFQHDSDRITIKLPGGVQNDSYHLVEIFYQGMPPSTGFGSFAVEKHNDVPAMWTLSEPYGAMEWWPCKQSLADKIDSLNVFITCPLQYKAASNGVLVSDRVSGDKHTMHWRHHYPIATYLVAFAVTNYETFTDFLELDSGRKLPVVNYVYPEYLETAKSKSADILSILDFYNKKFIEYPFSGEKYGHAQFGWGGGMEHQTMSFMYNLDYELVAHEMAHQWFGDYITLASWHDIWLNEGFATFLTGLTFENLQNGVWWPVWKKAQVDRITRLPDGSVYVADTANISRLFSSRLSYSKGAYLLHMLRWEMGDQKFFKGLQNYLTDPAVAYGFASQQKLVDHLEQAADTSLTEFFADWYYGEGFPTYRLYYVTEQGRVTLTLNQSSSHPSVGFFEMHVPVRVWKNGNYKDLRLFCDRQEQQFVISDSPIDSLQFDPERWLCAKADQVMSYQDISKPEKYMIINDGSLNRMGLLLADFSGSEVLQIYDLTGKTLMNIKLTGKETWIDTGGLHNRVYLFRILGGESRIAGKLILRP